MKIQRLGDTPALERIEGVLLDSSWPELQGASAALLLASVEATPPPGDVDAALCIVCEPSQMPEAARLGADILLSSDATAEEIQARVAVFLRGREEALLTSQQSEERLRRVLEQSRVALWDVDLTEDRLQVHGNGLASLGFDVAEQTASVQLFRERLHPEDVDRAVALWRQLSPRSPTLHDVELRILDAHGQQRWLLGRCQALAFDADDTPTHIIGTHIDITERKTLEEELRRAHKQDAIALMAGGIAHDFNNLLAIILNSAEILKLVGRTDDAVLQRIMSAVERGRDLVQQLLEASRQRVAAPRVTASVLGCLERALADHASLVPEHVEVRYDPEALAHLQVQASALVLPRVFANLISNACQALRGAPSGVISIRGERRGERVHVTLSDDGPGIPPDALERIFDPFFSTREDGTGLGLAVIHGLVTSSDGKISVESELGQGATFTVDLPAPAERAHSKHILVATSDALWGRALHSMLEALGYVADIRDSGEAARHALRDTPGRFDLALIDDPLTDTRSTTLAEHLRKHGDIPLLFAASGSNAHLSRDAERLDAIVLIKPFKLRALRDHLHALIGPPPSQDDEA